MRVDLSRRSFSGAVVQDKIGEDNPAKRPWFLAVCYIYRSYCGPSFHHDGTLVFQIVPGRDADRRDPMGAVESCKSIDGRSYH